MLGVAHPIFAQEAASRRQVCFVDSCSAQVGVLGQQEQSNPWVFTVQHMGKVNPAGALTECDVNQCRVGVKTVHRSECLHHIVGSHHLKPL